MEHFILNGVTHNYYYTIHINIYYFIHSFLQIALTGPHKGHRKSQRQGGKAIIM